VVRSLLIADDHAAFRRSARALLEAGGFVVVGEAADGAEAVAEAIRLRPDVVLLDIRLPDLDGFAVADLIDALDDAPEIVLTSSLDVSVLRARLARTTARGFLAKDELSSASLTELLA
jgi:DNA-binding NarL/FixJ family response regulator